LIPFSGIYDGYFGTFPEIFFEEKEFISAL